MRQASEGFALYLVEMCKWENWIVCAVMVCAVWTFTVTYPTRFSRLPFTVRCHLVLQSPTRPFFSHPPQHLPHPFVWCSLCWWIGVCVRLEECGAARRCRRLFTFSACSVRYPNKTMQSSFLLIVLFLFVVFNSPSTHMYSKSGTLLCPCTMVCWHRRRGWVEKVGVRGEGGRLGWSRMPRCMHRGCSVGLFLLLYGVAVPFQFTNSHREGSQYHQGAEPQPNQQMENSDERGREIKQTPPAAGCYADHI